MWTLIELTLAPALACGPFFPHALLTAGDDVLLGGPWGDLTLELTRIGVEAPPGVTYSGLDAAAADLADLEAALGQGDPRIAAVATWRASLKAEEAPTAPPPGLPPEFTLYLEGARAWHLGDRAAAATRWQDLLALPVGQRRWRSTWAAYMLARARPLGEGWYLKTRALAAEGFADSHGLASASLGWEAYERGWWGDAPGEGLRLYLQQLAAGDPGASVSLQLAARELAKDPAGRAKAASDPLAARVVTAWIVSREDEAAITRAWLAALEAAGQEAPGGDRLAWAAYQAGDMDAAARWLDASPETPMALWIRARLAARAGDVEAAAALLARAEFPAEERWSDCRWYTRNEWGLEDVSPAAEVSSERGAMLLAAGDYPGAMAAAARAGHWLDVAYVAERVLTEAELIAFVGGPASGLMAGDALARLRDLTGRRLARADRFDEAARFQSPAQRDAAERYRAALARGDAAGHWEAALIARHEGMDLFGAELWPDLAYSGGDYPPYYAGARPNQRQAVLPPRPAEAARAAASAPAPDERFHYRYKALEHAWRAAELLPEEADGLAARVLCSAGWWVAWRDPAAADRFYKAMVWRDFGSDLAAAADLLRWFPSPSRCAVTPEELAPYPPPATGCAAAGARPPAQAWLALLFACIVAPRRLDR